MKPLILKKHDETFACIRELVPEELDVIAGGATYCDTIIVTPDGDGRTVPTVCDGDGGS